MTEKKHIVAVQHQTDAVPIAFHQMPLKEQLLQIHQAQGKEKYRLIFNSSKPEIIVPRLHPQELYLTVNELGAEDSLELIALASPGQITLDA